MFWLSTFRNVFVFMSRLLDRLHRNRRLLARRLPYLADDHHRPGAGNHGRLLPRRPSDAQERSTDAGHHALPGRLVDLDGVHANAVTDAWHRSPLLSEISGAGITSATTSAAGVAG